MSAVTSLRGVSSDGSLLAAVTRMCVQCGENVVSGMIYALLGVSAMTRVSLSEPCVLSPIQNTYKLIVSNDYN